MYRHDFSHTAKDYARHRADFPEQLFTQLNRYGLALPGQQVLDLATGTGALARGFAERGCHVTGLDLAQPLLDEAMRLDRKAGVNVRYFVGRAEDTQLLGTSFDVVSVGQAWHWFDRARAAWEARRLLVPDGALIIAYLDWIVLPDNVVDATEALIAKHNPAWQLRNFSGINPDYLNDVLLAGFEPVESFSFDIKLQYTHEEWCGRVRASAGVGPSLQPEEVSRFDDQLRGLLIERFSIEPLVVPHRVFAIVARNAAI